MRLANSTTSADEPVFWDHYTIFRCQFIGRLLSSNRFQGDFGFDIRAIPLSLCFHSILSFPLLGFTLPFYLISLSSFWGIL
jgi:hypothetical protein